MKQIFAIVNDDKRESILALCREQSIEFKNISPREIGETVAGLLGIPMVPAADNPPVPAIFSPPEFMLFNGFPGGDLEKFLDAYQAKSIPPIKYKGTVTPYNLGWTVYKLIKEYEEESK